MRSITIIVAILFITAIPIALAGPTAGSGAKFEEIGATPWKTTMKFRGGERAAVLVANKAKTVGNFHVAIFDATNKLVAEDKNKTGSLEDMVGVTWFPPRDAEYRIEIKNLDGNLNSCYVTIK